MEGLKAYTKFGGNKCVRSTILFCCFFLKISQASVAKRNANESIDLGVLTMRMEGFGEDFKYAINPAD